MTGYEFKSQWPNYMTGRRGRGWAQSLRAAERHGAVIVTEETGTRVWYRPTSESKKSRRPWRTRGGKRYDSRECVPLF